MWTDSINADTLVNSFSSLIEKEVSSRGSFLADFEANLSTYSIIRCPFIQVSVTEDDLERVLITNAKIDISNLRAALLAILAVGSKVKEIYIHGCYLYPQHISDLATAVTKASRPLAVILQYNALQFHEESRNAYADAFASLFVESLGVEFVSLKGNSLEDSFLLKAIPNISANQRLKAVNLAENQLTDDFSLQLLNGLKFSHTIQALSLAQNAISATVALSTFIGYQIGMPVAATDEATIKTMTKALADKNKAVKELNKKRKKAGLIDAEEIVALPDFVKTTDGQKLFVNNSLKFIDFCGNPFDAPEVSELLSTTTNLHRIQEAGNKIVLPVLEGLQTQEYENWLILN